MAARLWQMIGAKIFLVIFVDGVPLLEWAHGGRMASAWWEHVGRILDTWSSITADVPTTNI